MKNLIYQYYDGPVLPGTKASVSMMKEYANRIGAEHLFEENPQKHCSAAMHFLASISLTSSSENWMQI